MNKLSNESKKIFTLDRTLVFLLLLSAAVSLVAIYLTYPLLGMDKTTDYLMKQIMWLVLSALVIFVLIKVGTDRLFTLVDVFYWVLMVFLFFLVLASFNIVNVSFMEEINGTHAWYQIPGLGSFQPSEFMKVVLVIKASLIITEHNKDKTSYSWESDFRLLAKILKWALPPLVLIILQPDTGIPIVILMSLAIMFMVSGVRKEWFLVFIAVIIIGLGGIVYLYRYQRDILNTIMGGSADNYRLTRFISWLDYESDPGNLGYHLFNSLISQGTAGWFGHDLGQIIMFIPEAQTDFIFAIISQNFGFVGASLIVILVFTLDIKLIHTIMRSKLEKERIMMIGIVGMIVFQDFQNIAMVLGVLPITGITLPFISYGGSSMMSYIIPLSVAFTMYSETENEHRH